MPLARKYCEQDRVSYESCVLSERGMVRGYLTPTGTTTIDKRALNRATLWRFVTLPGLQLVALPTGLERIFEDDHGLETLILCPKNLVPMWEDYRQQYPLRAKVVSLTNVQRELPDLRRYRLVLIDERHNLRNREGGQYRSIVEYIDSNDIRSFSHLNGTFFATSSTCTRSRMS